MPPFILRPNVDNLYSMVGIVGRSSLWTDTWADPPECDWTFGILDVEKHNMLDALESKELEAGEG